MPTTGQPPATRLIWLSLSRRGSATRSRRRLLILPIHFPPPSPRCAQFSLFAVVVV
jgi:hypothetical protein